MVHENAYLKHLEARGCPFSICGILSHLSLFRLPRGVSMTT